MLIGTWGTYWAEIFDWPIGLMRHNACGLTVYRNSQRHRVSDHGLSPSTLYKPLRNMNYLKGPSLHFFWKSVICL